MRIVAGDYRGRAIIAPKGMTARPTTDRTREALFNILAHRDDFSMVGTRVIDLFAGSGALGLEAISRGAAFALFVEIDAGARGAIRDNIDNLSLFGQTRIHRRSAISLGKIPANTGGPFNLAFLDPPYHQGLVEPAIGELIAGEWLAPDALLVIEQAKDEPNIEIDGISISVQRDYGDTRITIGSFGLTAG